MKDKILKMSRNELIDYLVENWTDVRRIYNFAPYNKNLRLVFSDIEFHTIENMREQALILEKKKEY